MSNITESPQKSPNAGGEKSAAIQESPGVVPNNHDHTSALVKRSSAIGLAIVFLVASLFGFSKVGHLDKWEQRGFNSLAILFTGIMSLGLGSLVGYMGSMIRWPLLARTTYGARDVDLILGMEPPQGALRLVWQHVQEWKWTRTTSIVALYLVVNISGRLSVAIFGLTFNLAETLGIEYPIQRSNWSEPSSMDRLRNYAQTGILDFATKLEPEIAIKDVPNLLEVLGKNLDIKNMTRRFDGDSIEYSYALGEYQGSVVIGSYKRIYSNASCNALSVNGSEVYYWADGRTENIDFANGTFNESALMVLRRTYLTYPTWIVDNMMAAPLPYDDYNSDELQPGPDPEYIWTYLYHEAQVVSQFNRIGVLWSCRSYLMDDQKKPGTVSGSGVPGANAYFVTNYLFTTALNERMVYMDNSTTTAFLHTMYPFLSTRETAATGLTTISVPYVQGNDNFKDPQSATAIGSRLYISALVARVPLLAIAVADSQLFRSNRDNPNATAKQYAKTSLEVQWRKVGATIGAIVVGQLLSIMVVLLYCRSVFIRDSSYLSTAKLLNTIMTKVEGGSLETGKQLARYLDDSQLKVKYGSKTIGERRVVDISHDVEQSFPPDQVYEGIPGA